MKKILIFLFISTPLTTFAFDILYQSRNMPADCHLVYQVQSEVKIALKNLEVEDTNWKLVYQLKDAYSRVEKYVAQKSIVFKDVSGEAQISWGFESMSTANQFLYREMRFQIIHLSSQKVMGTWFVSFGREFGEKCYNDSNSTPFIYRELKSLN